jgi:hypothetical protein
MSKGHLYSYVATNVMLSWAQTCPAFMKQAMFRYTETACRIGTELCLPGSAALRLAEGRMDGKT